MTNIKVGGAGSSTFQSHVRRCPTKMAVKRFWTFVLIFLGIFCEEVFSATDDKCIWLDKCGPHPDYSNKCLNCYREKPAEKLANHDIYKKLYEACPHFRFVFNISFPFHNCTECSQRNY